ncbi:MAG: phosphatidylserine decarboxylase [Planctomycetes bacterium]|nr:phosphatidylserine decarboxylase [Planctomycetota bacterium]
MIHFVIRHKNVILLSTLVAGVIILLFIFLLLRFTIVTGYLSHRLVKDPERNIPGGNVIVSPADGIVLYVRNVENGTIPEVVKKDVPVPIIDHLKTEPPPTLESGYLVGIYMNTHGVHLVRIPISGVIEKHVIFNGPHMDMTAAEIRIILSQMIPGLVTLRKLFGLMPYAIEDEAGYILKSARDTTMIYDKRGKFVFVIRIADYYVGKLLTWIKEGNRVQTGEKYGYITWGSQVDIFFESSPDIDVRVKEGDIVYGGETVLATY